MLVSGLKGMGDEGIGRQNLIPRKVNFFVALMGKKRCEGYTQTHKQFKALLGCLDTKITTLKKRQKRKSKRTEDYEQ